MAAIKINGTSPESVKALNKAILTILNAKHTDEATKQVALKVLEGGVKQGNHMVTNCVFEGKF